LKAITETGTCLTEFAPAKVNLALHVVGRRHDGYHTLDSVVAFADVGDELHFSPSRESSGIQLSVTGPFAAAVDSGPSNTVWQSWRALRDRHASKAAGIAIELVKNLPVASGLGGGTADAAAALRGLLRCWHLSLSNKELLAVAASLGADVPVSIRSTAQHMNGIGEAVSPLARWRPLSAVLVNPGAECLTSDIFQSSGLPLGEPAFGGLPPGVMSADVAWLRQCRNDLQHIAIGRLPVIAETIAMLERCPGIEMARMSGSGATCFGVFPTPSEARDAARSISRARPRWWVRETTLR
jgi:4-diphosphocytidyl-2-C-methyl-D-erythritol kinase